MTTLTTAPSLPEATGSTPDPGSSFPTWLVLLATSLPMFMATLDNLVMTTALPAIQEDLGATVGELAWFVNAYTLAFAAFMLPAATLGDRYGRRRIMFAGLVVFTMASIAAAASESAGFLVVARAIQGMGAAAIMPLSLALLATAVAPAKRAMAIGIWGGVSGLGVALGPVVGGGVVDGLSWQAIFWINLPVAAVALPLLLIVVPESRGREQRLDLLGTVFLGGAVLLAVWGIVRGNEDGWGSFGVAASLAAALILLPVYIVWARGRTYAVLPLRLFKSRGFSSANALGLFVSLGMFGAVFLLSQYLQIVMGYGPLEAGARTLPWTAAPMIVAPIAGMLVPRTGLRALLVPGLVLQAASLAWLAALTEETATYPWMIPALLIAGIGMGLTFAPSAAAVLHDLSDADFGVASSAHATIREFGIALGVATLTAVFIRQGGELTPDGYAGAVGPALSVGAAFVGLGAIAALFAPGRAQP